VKSWTEGERVTKASDIWSESRCSSGIRRRREREQPITHWEEKEWRSPLSLSEATTCEWCVKKRDEDFFLTVRRCIVVICTVVQFLSVCGMHPTTIHHEVYKTSDNCQRPWWRSESMNERLERRISKMSVRCNEGVEWDAKSDPLNQLKFRWSTCGRTSSLGRTNDWVVREVLVSQRLSQCNSVLYLLNHCLLQAQAQDEGKLVNRWENNDAPCDSLDLWPPYKPTLITTTFHIIPTQVP